MYKTVFNFDICRVINVQVNETLDIITQLVTEELQQNFMHE